MSVFDPPSPYLLLLRLEYCLEYCSMDVLLSESFAISTRVNLYGCNMGAAVQYSLTILKFMSTTDRVRTH